MTSESVGENTPWGGELSLAHPDWRADADAGSGVQDVGAEAAADAAATGEATSPAHPIPGSPAWSPPWQAPAALADGGEAGAANANGGAHERRSADFGLEKGGWGASEGLEGGGIDFGGGDFALEAGAQEAWAIGGDLGGDALEAPQGPAGAPVGAAGFGDGGVGFGEGGEGFGEGGAAYGEGEVRQDAGSGVEGGAWAGGDGSEAAPAETGPYGGYTWDQARAGHGCREVHERLNERECMLIDSLAACGTSTLVLGIPSLLATAHSIRLSAYRQQRKATWWMCMQHT